VPPDLDDGVASRAIAEGMNESPFMICALPLVSTVWRPSTGRGAKDCVNSGWPEYRRRGAVARPGG
jgi:hypothetical protein